MVFRSVAITRLWLQIFDLVMENVKRRRLFSTTAILYIDRLHTSRKKNYLKTQLCCSVFMSNAWLIKIKENDIMDIFVDAFD